MWSVSACTESGPHAGDSPDANQEAERVITNRIDVPPAVRQNLGITFAEVKRRRVASTLRAPGQFELTPRARREHHTPVAGRVELLVDQYEQVEAGTPLFRIDSPSWRQMQRQLSETVSTIRQIASRLQGLDERSQAIAKHARRLGEQEAIWTQRVAELESLIAAGSGAASELAQARAELAATRTELAKVDEEQAEIKQHRIDLESDLAGHRRATPLLYIDALGGVAAIDADKSPQPDLALSAASAMLGIPVAELRENAGSTDDPLPYWRVIDRIEIRAPRRGVIESLAVADGAWVEGADLIMTAVNPRQLRFRAEGLQADLGRLRDGMTVEILPPRGGPDAPSQSVKASLTVGLEANAKTRKIDLIAAPDPASMPSWARPGVAAEMAVVLDETAQPSLAIPTAAVIQDGLQKVIFRRDPRDPNKVIRLEADLGVSDGRWVVVESGVTDGDEVVHHGVYELMLASGGDRQRGGHFHADGTYHAEDH